MIKKLLRSVLVRPLLVLLVVCTAGIAPAKAQFVESERAALVALYEATSGDDWVRNDNWLSSASIDHWYGVQVTGTGTRQVVALNLSGNNLRGTLPPAFFNLYYIKTLDLSQNALSGPLPYNVDRLYSLTSLKLNDNPDLYGAFGVEIIRLSSLVEFWFDGTKLCELNTIAFQDWIAAIGDVRRSGCVAKEDVIGDCAPSLAEAYLEGNNVRARIPNNGELFYRGEPHFYRVPAYSDSNALFAASIWVGGVMDGALHVAAARYGIFEFWAGPLDDGGLPPSDCTVFDRVYKIDKQDIDAFEQSGTAVGDLAVWPTGLGAPTLDASGNRIDISTLTYAERLARRIDWRAGERPELPGDQGIWWIMNDRGNLHMETDSPSLGIEVHGFVYAVNSGAAALNNTTFYRYTLVNRNTQPINRAYFGVFVDPDLGNGADDYVGSDTLRGIAFVYNGNNSDGGPEGYGEAPPAVGFRVLRGAIADDDQFDNDRDGQIDEPGERPGMSHFVRISSGGSPNGDPNTGRDYYYIMQGMWKNGVRLLFGGNGLDQQVTSQQANYMYPGDPAKGEYWSEMNTDGLGSKNSPADRRFALSSGPFDLAPGEAKEIDFAIVYGRGIDYLDSITEMRRASDGVQAVFDGAFSWYPPGLRRTDTVQLQSPGTGATGQPTSLSLHWNPVAGASAYQVWLASVSKTRYLNTNETSIAIEDLESNTLYRWSVKGYSPSGTTPWSATRYFLTGDQSSAEWPLSFSVVRNASGALDPPDLGAFATSGSGFPSITCPWLPSSACLTPTRGYQQATNTSIWGIHAGGAEHVYGFYDQPTSFLGALSSGPDARERVGEDDYEWRWVGPGRGGLGWDQEQGHGLFDVGFELWNIGTATPNDPSDDYRMIPVIDVVHGGSPTAPETTYSIGGDQKISQGSDPFTNYTSWYNPEDRTPGETGFNDFVEGNSGLGELIFRNMVLVQLDAGVGPPYAVELPETGTVFRISNGAAIVPIPSAPGSGERLMPGPVHFYWIGLAGAGHRLQLSDRSDFRTTIFDFSHVEPGFDYYLKGDRRYFWRVQNERGFWSRTSSFLVTEGERGEGLESRFELHGNFPNPFADRTTLSYYLPFPAQVRMEVFDMLGRRVRVPIDGVQPDGQHFLPFDADNLTSGMYIYTFTVNDRRVTRKMVVAR